MARFDYCAHGRHAPICPGVGALIAALNRQTICTCECHLKESRCST